MRWTENEIEFLIENYEKYPTPTLIKMGLNKTEKQINDKAWRLGLKKGKEAQKEINKLKTEKFKTSRLGVTVSKETKEKLSNTRKRLFAEGKLKSPWEGRVVTEEEKEKARERAKGRWEGNSNPRHLNPLFKEQNGNWKGGITNLSQALRENITEWKKGSMELCNYRCIITGKSFDNIHHLKNFNTIIKESLKELGLNIRNSLNDYTLKEQNDLLLKIKEKHDILGVCLNKDNHKLFHDNYSYKNATKEDFLEFSKRYFNGEFDNLLSEENKSKNSNSDINKVIFILNNL